MADAPQGLPALANRLRLFCSLDVYPAPGHSWSRFFRNQGHLKDIRVAKDLAAVLTHVEALILAVPHEPYLGLDPQQIVQWAGAPLAVIDGSFQVLHQRAIAPDVQGLSAVAERQDWLEQTESVLKQQLIDSGASGVRLAALGNSIFAISLRVHIETAAGKQNSLHSGQ